MIILILIIFMIPIVLMTIPGSYTILFSGTIAFYFRKLFGHYLLCMVLFIKKQLYFICLSIILEFIKKFKLFS